MGGYGSTRWDWHSKKTTVEECRQLDTTDLLREGVLREGIHWVGGWSWRNAITGEKTSSIGLETDTTDAARPRVRLCYTFKSGRNEGRELDYRIPLQTTRPHFGGVRWWFTCPLSVNGRYCGRRVRKLYLPPGAVYYGCRHCYDLTYTSCQESDKRVSALCRAFNGDWLAILDAANKGEVDLIMALKATRKAPWWGI
jgi:hypothetical protein